MPAFDLIIGLALAVMALALISIWRRERIYGTSLPHHWRWFYRTLTILLILLAIWLVFGAFVLSRLQWPPRGLTVAWSSASRS